MPAVSIIIPFRPQPGRTDHLGYVIDRLAEAFPDAGLHISDDRMEPWSRACSINQGAREATGDLLIITDGDLVVGANAWHAAARMARDTPGQVIPYTRMLYLSAEATERFKATGTDPEPDWCYEIGVGGCMAITAEAYWRAGGHDPRFRGWGCQDHAFQAACATLVGPGRRVNADMVHLWHPLDPTNDRGSDTFLANDALAARYIAAAGNTAAMTAIINEREQP